MEKRTINSYVPVVSHDTSAAIVQQRKGTFDFVSPLVAAKFSSIRRWFLLSIGAMLANKFYIALSKTLSRWFSSFMAHFRPVRIIEKQFVNFDRRTHKKDILVTDSTARKKMRRISLVK